MKNKENIYVHTKIDRWKEWERVLSWRVHHQENIHYKECVCICHNRGVFNLNICCFQLVCHVQLLFCINIICDLTFDAADHSEVIRRNVNLYDFQSVFFLFAWAVRVTMQLYPYWLSPPLALIEESVTLIHTLKWTHIYMFKRTDRATQHKWYTHTDTTKASFTWEFRE